MIELQQNYFEWLDIWDDWIADWLFEEELRTQANEYLEKSWLVWDAKTQLENALWDLLQTWDIDKGKLEEWYKQSKREIDIKTRLETRQVDYWLSRDNIDSLLEIESFFDFDIFNSLEKYDDYIKTNLEWKLSPDIIKKIKLSIWRRLLWLSNVVEDLREEELSRYGNLDNFVDAKRIINSRMQENMSFINDQLLPSASLYVHFWRVWKNEWILKDWPWVLNMLTKYSREWDPVWLSFTWIDLRLEEIEEMFKSDVDEEWNFDEWFFSTQRIYDASDEEQVRRYFHGRKIEKVEWVSILNEEDKALDDRNQMYFMAAVAAQIAVEIWPAYLWPVWVAAWAIVWWWVDVYDVFSSDEALLTILQSTWLVDSHYRMDKTWIDNVLAWIWILPGMTAVIKWKRVAEYVSKIPDWKFKQVFEKVVDAIYYSMRLWKEEFKDFDSIIEWVRKIKKSWEKPSRELVESIARLWDEDRIRVAEELLWKDIWEELRTGLLRVHNANGAQVFEHTFGDIRWKLKEAKNLDLIWNWPDQITRKQFKELMDYGVLWTYQKFILKQLWKLELEKISVKDIPITISLWYSGTRIQIIKTTDLPTEYWDFKTPYLIIQPDVFSSSNWARWFKRLRDGEPVKLWRGHEYERFDFPWDVSWEHLWITFYNWEINIQDLWSTNWTFIFKGVRNAWTPIRRVQTSAEDSWLISKSWVVWKIDEITFSDFMRFASREIKTFLSNTNLKVKHKLSVNWQDFLLTDKFISNDYEFIVWFVKIWNTYEPRLFYFSKSWWNWHCAPWIELDWRYSKWEFMWLSYEKWTVVNSDLQSAFSWLSSSWINVSDVVGQYWDNFGYISSTRRYEYTNPQHLRFVSENSVEIIWEEWLTLGKLDKDLDKDAVISLFKNLDISWFDLRMFRRVNSTRETQMHKYLWEIEINRFQTSLNWKIVEIVYANTPSEPWLIWIENIYYPTAIMNSYWLPKASVNAWLLTTKPYEYKSQVPYDIIAQWRREGRYVDVRPFIQENPLIRRFRQEMWYGF